MEKANMGFKNQILRLLGFGLVTFATISLPNDSFAQDKIAQTDETVEISYNFIKKHYSITGNAKIIKTSDETEIVFSEDFETRSGPDLKVYLSKLSISDLKDASVGPNSLKLGVLKSRKGAQSYVIPEDISLKNYKSIVIHCEAYSKLWGGFDL